MIEFVVVSFKNKFNTGFQPDRRNRDHSRKLIYLLTEIKLTFVAVITKDKLYLNIN